MINRFFHYAYTRGWRPVMVAGLSTFFRSIHHMGCDMTLPGEMVGLTCAVRTQLRLYGWQARGGMGEGGLYGGG